MESESLKKRIYYSILGTALGDSIGLPFEGLSREKIAKKEPDFGSQSLIFGRGLISDDTEHTLIVAQALIESYDDLATFKKRLRRRLQLWLLSLPAGVGFATMRGIFKSFFTDNSGVFSAGNAPAMRSALLGIVFGADNNRLKKFVEANSKITHTDPKAYFGALAVAKASYLSSISQEDRFFEEMRDLVADSEFLELLSSVEQNLEIPTQEFAKKIGLERGVSGYIYQTLPIVIHSWLRNRENLKKAIIDVVVCGGDTDTTGAIVGGIVGAKAKEPPKEWLDGFVEYPRNLKFVDEVSSKLADIFTKKRAAKAPDIAYPLLLLRNIFFLIVILIVAIKR